MKLLFLRFSLIPKPQNTQNVAFDFVAPSPSIHEFLLRLVSVGSMLGQRHRRWHSMEPTLTCPTKHLLTASTLHHMLTYGWPISVDIVDCKRRWISYKQPFVHHFYVLHNSGTLYFSHPAMSCLCVIKFINENSSLTGNTQKCSCALSYKSQTHTTAPFRF